MKCSGCNGLGTEVCEHCKKTWCNACMQIIHMHVPGGNDIAFHRVCRDCRAKAEQMLVDEGMEIVRGDVSPVEVEISDSATPEARELIQRFASLMGGSSYQMEDLGKSHKRRHKSRKHQK